MTKLDRRSIIAGGLAGAVAASAARAESRAELVPLPRPAAGRIPVAFLVDDGANMIDLAGAWEVFQDARGDARSGGDRAFLLYTVAPEKRTYQTTGNGPGGLIFTPHYTFEDAPAPKVISMGAQGGADNPAKLDWIRRMAPGADIVMSVCTGAFVLARTGLIDGKEATTHHEYFDGFAEMFPKVKLIRTARFVDNGKFVSAGGLTSGIDSALHVVARYFGEDAATATAEYMEYAGDGWRTGKRS